MMEINELVKIAHDNAVNKGFYDCDVKCSGVGSCDYDGSNCNEKDNCGEYEPIKSVKKNKNIGELLMLVVSELGEALEAHRKGKHSDLKVANMDSEKHTDKTRIITFEGCIKDTFEDELADAVIRIADICGYSNIDLEKHIELKMKYNETREYKHGKKY